VSVFRGASVGVTLTANKSKYSRELKEARAEMRDWERTVDRSMSRARKGFGTFGRVAAVGLAVAGTAAAAAGVKMIQMAGDAAEVDSKLSVTFGKTLPMVTARLDAFAEATGASRYQLRQQAADVGALLKPMGLTSAQMQDMSVRTVQLATDLSSFNNVPVDDALQALRSGLTGETEPLKRFGILMNEAAIQTEAVRIGLSQTGKDLTEQQKVQARYSLILKQTTDTQGDAVRTSDSYANTIRRIQNSVRDAGTQIGQSMLPGVTRLANGLASFVSSDTFDQHVQSIGDQAYRAANSVASFMQSAEGREVLRDAGNAAMAFGSALATVTRFAIDHRNAIANLAIGYGAFRVITGILTPLNAAWQLGQVRATQFAAANAGAARSAVAARFAMGALGGPIGLVATAAAIGAVEFINYKRKMANVETQGDRTARAVRNVSSAMRGLNNSALELDEARLNRKLAMATLDDARERLRSATRGTKEYRDAVLAVEQAELGLKRANSGVAQARKSYNDAVDKGSGRVRKLRAEIQEERATIQRLLPVVRSGGTYTNEFGQKVGVSAGKLKELRRELKDAQDRLDKAKGKLREAQDGMDSLGQRTSAAASEVRQLASALREVNSAAADYKPPKYGGMPRGPLRSGRGAAKANPFISAAREQVAIDLSPERSLAQARRQFAAAQRRLRGTTGAVRMERLQAVRDAAATVAQREQALRDAVTQRQMDAAARLAQAAEDQRQAAEEARQAAEEARQNALDAPRTAMTLTDAMRDLERAQAEATATLADDIAVAQRALADEQTRQGLIQQALNTVQMDDQERAALVEQLASSVRASNQLQSSLSDMSGATAAGTGGATLDDLLQQLKAATQAIYEMGATEAGNVFSIAKVEQNFPAGTGMDTWRLATQANLQGAVGA
jgi:hypothetical protein